MDYNSMSLSELRNLAKERGLKSISALRKAELIERLELSEENKTPKFTVKKAAAPEETVKEKPETVKEKPEKEAPASNDASLEAQNAAYINRQKNIQKQDNQRNYQNKPYQNNNAQQQKRYPANNQGNYQNYNRNNEQGYQGNYQNFNRPQGAYHAGYQQNRNYNAGFEPNRGYQQYPNQGYQQYQNQPYDNQRNFQGQPGGQYNNQNFQQPGGGQGFYQQGYQQPAQHASVQYQGNQPAQPAQPAPAQHQMSQQEILESLDSGISREGVLEVLKTEGYGFIRCDNYLPGEEDVYISPTQIRKYSLKTGDLIKGNLKKKSTTEKYQGMVSIETVNGEAPEIASKRRRFEDLTPEFPHERIHLETPGSSPAMRIVDLISPVGKGQRGMIVSQPKAGKTTLLKQIANAITVNHPEMKIIILLIDERPEEVTDIKESIKGENVEVIYSTFDELPDNHKRVSEMVIERAKRLVEYGQNVCILLDSITRLARAYNLTVENSGRTLSGGLDPAALYMPKKFFGAARCMREGGSLTILATALVDTGSRMDDVVFEEFKGTGNMELVLDRSLSERRIFPAIDLPKSGTRREDLLLDASEYKACFLMRQALNGAKSDEAIEIILNLLRNTKTNAELVEHLLQHGVFGKTTI